MSIIRDFDNIDNLDSRWPKAARKGLKIRAKAPTTLGHTMG